jgi:signal peptidase I
MGVIVRTTLFIIIAFAFGIAIGGVLHGMTVVDVAAAPSPQQPASVSTLAFTSTTDMAAPSDHIPESAISVLSDKVVIDLPGAVWAKFTPSGSMKPVFDTGANAIEVVPSSPGQINVGDIVSYQSDWMDTPVIHRVIQTGTDSEGWYAVMKGDNNSTQDPGKVRFPQVRRVVVAVIY